MHPTYNLLDKNIQYQKSYLTTVAFLPLMMLLPLIQGYRAISSALLAMSNKCKWPRAIFGKQFKEVKFQFHVLLPHSFNKLKEVLQGLMVLHSIITKIMVVCN